MYIEQAFKSLHEWWRYVVGILIIFFVWQVIGSFPLIGALLYSIGTEGIINGDFPTDIAGMSDILGNNLFLFLMLLSFAIGLVGLIFNTKTIHKQSFTELTTTRKKIDWSRFWFIFILWGVVSSFFVLLDFYLEPESYQWNFQLVPFLTLAVIAILFIPLQTSLEEYLFRGYLMQGLGVITKTRWFPLIFTSVVFGLMHIANPEVGQLGYIIMVYYIGTGFFLGIITLMDDGLELALGFHAANNLFTALLVTADWTALQTDSLLKDISEPTSAGFLDVFMPVFVVFPILIFILAKKYQWADWKDKLFGRVEEPIKEDYKILD
ncbi:CPBP family intramembrane glutamic endopeptidase [Oceanihabitans sediminis]|uniref:CPBP family intramembrane metalloprotease n=1 Tax=Oceanihabitans sediminis TaxID=1812012 RepID=A0A368P6U7_9FLAO|nr:CPBP family intramembrane glutamic endopeptidase [Oceanihabitans sediminis]MDX1277915.1 CPBP family intramembrane glutamic endopeptidase [Oceanihabitans sediminis]MDX1773401.1 CPBP family intramembrane glutamic endopeptidase [Oceanihabitans sediminis]RBP32857.1 hypothetical protein DFR65_102193 [Oceanihabitans sediminis]RCU57615.1 CPBP family intramembrane metalloprotease [Oceanihabitans sediminis]